MPTASPSASKKRVSKKAPANTTSLSSLATRKPGSKPSEEKNAAPSQWGRRMARLVGDKFGVNMAENHAKNEGIYKGKDIVIKCAKSPMPPVSILVDMLERLDQVWAVYVMFDGTAEVWSIDVANVRKLAYFTHGANVQKRAEIYLRRITPVGSQIGTLTEREVEACRIP